MPRKRTSSSENPDVSLAPVPDSVAMPPPSVIPSYKRKSSRTATPTLNAPDSIAMPPPSNAPVKKSAHRPRSVFVQLPKVQPKSKKLATTPELIFAATSTSAHSSTTPVAVTTYMPPPSLPSSSPPPIRASEIMPPPAIPSASKKSIATKLQSTSERAFPTKHSVVSEEAPRDVSTPFNGSSTSMPPPVASTSKGVSAVMPPPATSHDVSVALFDTASATKPSPVSPSSSESVKVPLPTIPSISKEVPEILATPDVPSTSKGVVRLSAEI